MKGLFAAALSAATLVLGQEYGGGSGSSSEMPAATGQSSSGGSSASQIQTNCPTGGSLCYSVHVAEAAASSGQGDIYVQLRAPTSYRWAGMGQGDEMAGAHMFIMYANAAGDNVTVSPRTATGEFEPQFDSNTQMELLEGTGIADGMMTANVLCHNCNSWRGGQMSFNSASSGWIWSFLEGGAVRSDAKDADLTKHTDRGNMQFDLTRATGGTDGANPFMDADTGSSSSGSSSSGGGTSGGMAEMILTAHGTIMGLVVAVLLPIGAMTRRIRATSNVWIHAGIQMLGWTLAIAGVGCGIWYALYSEQLQMAHPIIGLIVFSLLVGVQPVLGLLQHMHYRKTGTRGAFGWVHKSLGFGIILLGIINGGLGLMLAGNMMGGMIAYAVIAAVFGATWLGVVAFSVVRKRGKGAQAPVKHEQTSQQS